MELTVLGSGTCAVVPSRSMASYHLRVNQTQLLLDIGAGALRRLAEADFDYRDIDAIFITHLHIDHIADLVPFLWATRYTPGFSREKALEIFGPPGVERWFGLLAEAHGKWMLDLPFSCEINEISNTEFVWNHLVVKTLPMVHGVPANGYRWEDNGKSLVYTGDTGFCENAIALAKNADLLVIESSLPDGEEPMATHLTPGLAGKIAAGASAKRVVLTHFYPACEDVDLVAQCKKFYFGNIELAKDLRRFIIQ